MYSSTVETSERFKLLPVKLIPTEPTSASLVRSRVGVVTREVVPTLGYENSECGRVPGLP